MEPFLSVLVGVVRWLLWDYPRQTLMPPSCCLLYQIGRIGDTCGKLQRTALEDILLPCFALRQNELGERFDRRQPNAAASSGLYSQWVGSPDPIEPEPSHEQDNPRRNLFWMFISFMGVSLPKAGQERRAMLMIIVGVLLFLAFIAVGILTVFRFW